jgi:hypothetical protein
VAYADLLQLRSSMSISDAVDDSLLQTALDAASAWVDRTCGRTFEKAGVATARTYFTKGGTVWPDDIASTTGLVVQTGGPSAYPATLALGTGFYLLPTNAVALNQPYTEIQGPYFIPSIYGYPTVQVTALWGWPSVPAEVTMATVLTAARLFKRKDSPEGVAGFSDFGAIRIGRTDPDIDRLLTPYKRLVVV